MILSQISEDNPGEQAEAPQDHAGRVGAGRPEGQGEGGGVGVNQQVLHSPRRSRGNFYDFLIIIFYFALNKIQN